MKKLTLKILNLYMFLFIFTMINREFLLFSIDLRYVALILGVILLFIKCLSKNLVSIKNISRLEKLIFLFFIIAFISNISWNWNGLIINNKEFNSILVLYVFNFVAFLTIMQYKNSIYMNKIHKYVIFSCIVLLISFIFVAQGYNLSQISGSTARSISRGGEFYNFFGGNYRIAGYAEDANYATLFLIIGLFSIRDISKSNNFNKVLRLIFSLIFILGIAYSFSRSVLLGLIIGIVYVLIMSSIEYRYNKIKNITNLILIIGIILVVIILPKLGILNNLNTIATRYRMWNIAYDLFEKSPIIGNGLTSFRSQINEIYNWDWYVQSHSTYWQVLAENGTINFIVLQMIIYICLKNNSKNKNNLIIFITYLFFSMSYEAIYLQVTIYIIYLLQITDNSKNNKLGEKRYE